MAEIQILSTKTLHPNQKQILLNAGLLVNEIDFVKVNSLTQNIKNGEKQNRINETLIFTSQNAVTTVLEFENVEKLKAKKVFCVGSKTKTLLEENGFQVEVYTNYSEDLAQIISLVYSDSSYTFFCGNLRQDTLPKTLKNNKIIFNEIMVYETILTPQKINSAPNGILFFSPSGVESYLKLNTIKNEICFCIGKTTAKALENRNIKTIIIAENPSVENVIMQCITKFK